MRRCCCAHGAGDGKWAMRAMLGQRAKARSPANDAGLIAGRVRLLLIAGGFHRPPLPRLRRIGAQCHSVLSALQCWKPV